MYGINKQTDIRFLSTTSNRTNLIDRFNNNHALNYNTMVGLVFIHMYKECFIS